MVAMAICPLSQTVGQMWKVRLDDGSSISGQLVSSGYDNRVGIQGGGFKSPFDFDAFAILSLSRVVSKTEVAQEQQPILLQFELVDGARFLGKIGSLDPEQIVIDSPALGKLSLDRTRLRSISKSDNLGELLYNGPSDIDRWSAGKSKDSTTSIDSSSLSSIAGGVTVATNLQLPDQAHIFLELSWRDGPNFVIVLGTTQVNLPTRIEEAKASARLEVWNGKLVLVRETDVAIDFVPLLDLTNSSMKRVQINIHLDQRNGEILATDEVGRQLGEIRVQANRPNVGTCIHISNYGGSLSLDQLQVRKWSAFLTKTVVEKDVVVLKNGRKVLGSLVGWDSTDRKFLLATSNGNQTTIEPNDLALMTLLPSEGEPRNQTVQNRDLGLAGYVNVVLSDQSRFRAKFLASSTDRLKLEIAGIPGNFEVPCAQIASIFATRRNDDRISNSGNNDESIGKTGVMKIDETVLSGRLAINGEGNGSSALVWHPTVSRNASSLVEGTNGSILFQKEVSEQAQAKATKTVGTRPNDTLLYIGGRKKSSDSEAYQLAFENGDVIEGKVLQIDEKGVKFESNQTNCQLASHEQIQSISLVPIATKNDLNSDLLKRLTTVPRVQKDHAPTHLLISKSGDYMRGQLLGLIDGEIAMDVRSKTAKIPLSKISRIVWLHHHDWQEAQTSPLDANGKVSAEEFSIHVMRENDRGITFRPRSLINGKLNGISDLFGECSEELAESSRIFFGRDISKQIMLFRQNPWTLSLARFPLAFLDEPDHDEQKQAGATTSKLIGKRAEDFTLKDLDGSEFQLSKYRGRIVVLDFWASWCGPCMQSLPKVDQLISRLESDKIVLAAINVQEPADTAQAALARLGIRPMVLLDEQGKVAVLYGATAIPQTVIVGADGAIKQIIVGGSQEARDRIRTALLSELK